MSRHRQRRRGKAALGSLQQIFVVVEISSPYPNRRVPAKSFSSS